MNTTTIYGGEYFFVDEKIPVNIENFALLFEFKIK